MKKTHSKAFSLIELSIVILVFGVLIAGVMQGTNMVRKSQLQTARNLTTSSPIIGVKDLMLWYETSLESSFKTTEAMNNTEISVWYDNNKQSIANNNATQGFSSFKPKFIENVFQGIPAIRFDGLDDSLSYNGQFLAKINYTIFVVEQRRSSGINYFMGGTNQLSNTNLYLGYQSSTSIAHSHFNSNMFFDTTNYSFPTPKIHTFWFSKTSGKKYWLQGGNNPDKTSPTQTTELTSYNGSAVGKVFNSYYYNGDIAEIVIFARDLKDVERRDIEAYLSKKYNIAITG